MFSIGLMSLINARQYACRLMDCLFCFSSFFGNFGFRFSTGGNGGQREIPRGGTITMDLDVSLEDLYKGKFIEVRSV